MQSDMLLENEKLRADMAPYFDEIGLVCPKPGEGTGNGILYLAEYIMILHKRKCLTIDDSLAFLSALTKCNAGLPRGLFHRAPWNKGQEGQDDYIGIGAACVVTGNEYIARDILEYGRSHPIMLLGRIPVPYFYNNRMPGTCWEPKKEDPGRKWYLRFADRFAPEGLQFNGSAFLGRHISLIAHLQFSAGERVPGWRKICWLFDVLSACWHVEDQDEWILSWLQIQTARGKFGGTLWTAAFDGVEAVWLRTLYKHWPQGLRSVLMRYFNHPHPIAFYFVTKET
jgi:hypothetical protein